MKLREVLITVSNEEVPGLSYMARSFPDDDYDDNGRQELYKVPVYYVYIEGTDNKNNSVKKIWKALRFMPYWNPEGSKSGYKTIGWVNAGIYYYPKSVVKEYKPNYSIHNVPGISKGAIVIKDSFYIHEGPGYLTDYGIGSAGCVEIIGSFNEFKEDIKNLSGCNLDADSAILNLVKEGKLYLEVKSATPPDIRNFFWKEFNKYTREIYY